MINKEILSWDELFMRQVYLIASKSLDPRTKIGSVIVRDKIPLSLSYNGFPRGVKDLPERYEDRETKLQFVAHSEFNAVVNCARHGISTLGTSLYTCGFPCNNCMKAILQAGITEVVLHKQWGESSRWNEDVSKIMQEESGLKIRYFDKELGIEVLNNGELIKV